MKFSPITLAVALFGLTSARVVKAAGCTGESEGFPLLSICSDEQFGRNTGPEGFSKVCQELNRLKTFPQVAFFLSVAANERDQTIFVPNNAAFGNLDDILDSAGVADLVTDNDIADYLIYPFIAGKVLLPEDLLCSSSLHVTFTEGRPPKIRCADDIEGFKSSFIVGPGNNFKLGNLPRLTRGSKRITPEPPVSCNGVPYGVDNVILPKFMKDLINDKIPRPTLPPTPDT